MTYVDISVDNPIRPYNLIMECTDHDKVMDIYVAILLEELISNIGHPDLHTWTPCVLHNQDDQVPRCGSRSDTEGRRRGVSLQVCFRQTTKRFNLDFLK